MIFPTFSVYIALKFVLWSMKKGTHDRGSVDRGLRGSTKPVNGLREVLEPVNF